MFESPFIESVLCLIFVFGILSALASLLQEIQAQYLEIRPQFLVQAVQRMLSDDPDNAEVPSIWAEGWDFLKKGLKIFSFPASFPVLRKWTLLCPVARKVMDDAEAKGGARAPVPESSEASVDPSAPPPRMDLEKGYLLVDAFFENSLIKYLGAKDSKRPSYISKELFTSALVDICHLKKYPEIEKDLAALEFGPVLPKSVKGVLEAFVKEAFRSSWHEKDSECRKSSIDRKFRELIGNWYEDTMHRATGWYKRDAGKWLFWWGLALALMFNADTFRLFKHFMADVDARQIVKSQAIQLNGKSAEEKAKYLPTADTALTPVDSLQARLASRWNGEIKALDSAHVFGWKFATIGLDGSAGLGTKIKAFVALVPGMLRKILFAMPGLLATALAISFGAPFWFDILSSLVKLGGTNASVRYSGVKPSEKKN